MNPRRKMLRWQLRNGKLTPAAYRARLRRVDVGAKDDEINAPRRRWAWAAVEFLKAWPQERRIANMLRQMHLVEVIYNPTKRFRFRRGEPILLDLVLSGAASRDRAGARRLRPLATPPKREARCA